jgi:DNA modification methylase
MSYRVLNTDAVTGLRQLPERSVHVCVTSPPYFAMRSYLPKDHPDKPLEIGSEKTVEAFIAAMVTVFREVRRVLRDDGVLWLNLGDGYSAGGWECRRRNVVGARSMDSEERKPSTTSGLSEGNLQNIPHRVAEALRADGWVWRQTIVWAKRSPMPESVNGWRWQRCGKRKWPESLTDRNPELRRERQQGRDFGLPVFEPCPGCSKCAENGGYVLRRGAGRCTTAHEYLFLLTKTNRYFWDSEASKERASRGSCGSRFDTGKTGSRDGGHRTQYGYRDGEQRNPRSVWTLSSEPTSVRHFATFPSELVRRCLASSPAAGGVCAACGAPYAPVVHSQRVPTRPAINNKGFKHSGGDEVGQRSASSPNLDPQRHVAVSGCVGYRATCSCAAAEKTGPMILDPFAGTGTVAGVCEFLHSDSILIELNHTYAAMIDARVADVCRRLHAKAKGVRTRRPSPQQPTLFGAEKDKACDRSHQPRWPGAA